MSIFTIFILLVGFISNLTQKPPLNTEILYKPPPGHEVVSFDQTIDRQNIVFVTTKDSEPLYGQNKDYFKLNLKSKTITRLSPSNIIPPLLIPGSTASSLQLMSSKVTNPQLFGDGVQFAPDKILRLSSSKLLEDKVNMIKIKKVEEFCLDSCLETYYIINYQSKTLVYKDPTSIAEYILPNSGHLATPDNTLILVLNGNLVKLY